MNKARRTGDNELRGKVTPQDRTGFRASYNGLCALCVAAVLAVSAEAIAAGAAPVPSAAARRANSAFLSGRYELALKRYETAAREVAMRPHARYMGAVCLFELERYEAAAELFESVYAEREDFYTARLLADLALARAQDTETSLGELFSEIIGRARKELVDKYRGDVFDVRNFVQPAVHTADFEERFCRARVAPLLRNRQISHELRVGLALLLPWPDSIKELEAAARRFSSQPAYRLALAYLYCGGVSGKDNEGDVRALIEELRALKRAEPKNGLYDLLLAYCEDRDAMDDVKSALSPERARELAALCRRPLQTHLDMLNAATWKAYLATGYPLYYAKSFRFDGTVPAHVLLRIARKLGATADQLEAEGRAAPAQEIRQAVSALAASLAADNGLFISRLRAVNIDRYGDGSYERTLGGREAFGEWHARCQEGLTYRVLYTLPLPSLTRAAVGAMVEDEISYLETTGRIKQETLPLQED